MRFIVAAVLCSLSALALGQVRIEVHAIASLTMPDQDFLNGRKDGKAVTLAGELRIPRPGTERLPLVVLLHGSGGVGINVAEWAEEFAGMGMATFILDAFTGR